MYCSRCGQTLVDGQQFCAQCGQAISSAALEPLPLSDLERTAYAGKLRTLTLLWAIYAALSLVLGLLGLTAAHAFFAGMQPWFDAPMRNEMPAGIMSFFFHIAWIAILLRTALAAVAAWGLWERTPWGRIVAIVAGCLSLLKFPLGTALGIWTLIVLLGERNRTLYEQNSAPRP